MHRLTSRAWLATALGVTLGTAITACGGSDSPSTDLVCGTGVSGALTAGTTLQVPPGDSEDLAGAAVSVPAAGTAPSATVAIGCAPDIVPAGYVALGPAVQFGPAGAWSDRPFDFTVPYKAARLPATGGRRHIRIVAQRHVGDTTPFFAPVSNRLLDDTDPFASTVRFRAGELATYQAVAAVDAGAPRTERFAYKAITGISMGGNAAMAIGLRNPDKFDLIADIGGEPGPSMVYTLTMIRDYLFGGFCTAADEAAGLGAIGELCLDRQRPPYADQHEIASTFERMVYQEGSGVGLTLSRDLYMKASRDLARALSNPAVYNPDDPYLPPGVTWTYLEQSAAERCANPLVLADFFDREFNPDGSRDVITFCDGNDSEAMGLGVMDPSIAPDNPAEILLAVDVDGDGVRDPGEPIITNAYEPFADLGPDGVASANEPGYDAATNPDPAGDDYHYQRNPRGTEGNLDRDEGEAYEDVGLDGVAGTCQHGTAAACYDFGEADGSWTVSPNVERWYENDIAVRLAALTPAERAHVGLWFDAGIRDFLNNSVSSNRIAGVVSATHQLPFAIYDGFQPLAGVGSENGYDFTNVNWGDLPKNGYLRYGDPDAQALALEQGDGRHVGTAAQIINRVTSAFAWIDKRWPNSDRDDVTARGRTERNLEFTSPSTGRVTPFGLFLPPGYDDPAQVAKRYPVIFFLHGYGQDPSDLAQLSGVFETYMYPSELPPEDRFGKFIIVYVDGRCRPNLDGVPVDPTGDGCERGTFYLDAPLGGPAQMETHLLELMAYVDTNYRTRLPEDVVVSD